MRVTIDRSNLNTYLVLADTPVATSATLADGLVVDRDASGRIVGVTIHTDDPAALAEIVVDLGGASERPAQPAIAPRVAPAPAPKFYDGALNWEPEAEAAMNGVPFFQRGPVRLAAAALARKRGSAKVTVALVQDARAGAR